jgi:hypothetical protein
MWRRSDRGNLVRGSPLGWRLTVFERVPGRYGWSIARSAALEYSPRSYRSEAAAAEAVWAEVMRRG